MWRRGTCHASFSGIHRSGVHTDPVRLTSEVRAQRIDLHDMDDAHLGYAVSELHIGGMFHAAAMPSGARCMLVIWLCCMLRVCCTLCAACYTLHDKCIASTSRCTFHLLQCCVPCRRGRSLTLQGGTPCRACLCRTALSRMRTLAQ